MSAKNANDNHSFQIDLSKNEISLGKSKLVVSNDTMVEEIKQYVGEMESCIRQAKHSCTNELEVVFYTSQSIQTLVSVIPSIKELEEAGFGIPISGTSIQRVSEHLYIYAPNL